jgi:type I restriction enzyme S subunit
VLLGDVLLLRGSGSRALVGRAGIVTSQPPEGCIYPDILIRVRPGASLAPWFLVNCLNSAAARPQIELAAKTAAGIWKITGEDVRGLVLPVPPYPEQLQVETEVLRTTVALESTIARIHQASDRLKELRTALVSAAVTGKIDVREEAA